MAVVAATPSSSAIAASPLRFFAALSMRFSFRSASALSSRRRRPASASTAFTAVRGARPVVPMPSSILLVGAYCR